MYLHLLMFQLLESSSVLILSFVSFVMHKIIYFVWQLYWQYLLKLDYYYDTSIRHENRKIFKCTNDAYLKCTQCYAIMKWYPALLEVPVIEMVRLFLPVSPAKLTAGSHHITASSVKMRTYLIIPRFKRIHILLYALLKTPWIPRITTPLTSGVISGCGVAILMVSVESSVDFMTNLNMSVFIEN